MIRCWIYILFGQNSKNSLPRKKIIYLGSPAINLVKELYNIDEIWERLTKFYGNARLLLHIKLRGLAEIGGLDGTTDKHELVYGISELLNAMTELSRLAEKFGLEHKLYQSEIGVAGVYPIIGEARIDRVLRKAHGTSLSEKNMWHKIVEVLKFELDVTQEYIILDKARQPICSVKAGMPYQDKSDEESDEGDCNVSVIDGPDLCV